MYSLTMNRHHCSVMLLGNATRMAFSLGLNHSISEEQVPCLIEREQRIRIWWTIYVLDRHSLKKGTSPLVHDDDVNVDLPSDIPDDLDHEEFGDAAYLVASVKLAEIIGQVISKIYGRKKHQEPFLQRQQKLLISLKEWLQSLPQHLCLSTFGDGSRPQHVVYLHLQFNHCVMLATRSILLYRLVEKCGAFDSQNRDTSQKAARGDSVPTVSRAVDTLCEACIQAARRSCLLFIQEWTQGSIPMFGFSNCPCLFASGLVLAVASQSAESSAESSRNDNDCCFDEILEILRVMMDNGNPVATQQHFILDKAKQAIDGSRTSNAARCSLDSGYDTPQVQGAPGTDAANPNQHVNLNPVSCSKSMDTFPTTSKPLSIVAATSDMALPFSTTSTTSCTTPTLLPPTATGHELPPMEMQFLDQSLEDFLAKPPIDLEQLGCGAMDFGALIDGGGYRYGDGNFDNLDPLCYWPSSTWWA